jgi:hypothetical protein
VGVHSANRQHQPRGDFGVGQPIGKQPDHVGLPLGESGGIVSCCLDAATRDAADAELSQPKPYLARQRLGAKGVERGESSQQVGGVGALGASDACSYGQPARPTPRLLPAIARAPAACRDARSR